MSRAQRLLLYGSLLAVLVSVSGYAVLRVKYPPVPGWTVPRQPHAAFEVLDSWIRPAFLDASRPDSERYADLFRYLVAGFIAYRSEGSAKAYYPGIASTHGREIDALEGFSRIAPLVAAWLAGGRPATVQVPSFGEVNLLSLLRSGITAGTDPASAEYWGDIGMLDQRVVESADVALAVWLARDLLWPVLDQAQRTNLVNWLRQSTGKADNSRFVNWRLFTVIVDTVLRSLGEDVSDNHIAADWKAVRASHAGEGWFQDADDGRFDYYNAWSFHYGLYWLAEIDPHFETGFIDEARKSFVGFYRHLVTPHGFPVLGRSICYRTAMPVPLLISSVRNDQVVTPGQARRALNVIWEYFIAMGALRDGVLTQGYCGTDPRILDTYSGPASCLWGARSLVVAFSRPDDTPLWTHDELPLPVELGDFVVNNETTGWEVTGDRGTKSVVIRRAGYGSSPKMKDYSLRYRLASILFRRPFGPGNRQASYNGAEYSSAEPFCGCRSQAR